MTAEGPDRDDLQLTHRAFLASLSAQERAELTTRSDRAGLQPLFGHLGLIAALMIYVAAEAPFWGLAIWPLGVALAFLFTLQHECTHRTPFASSWLNEAVGHGTGLILVQPFAWFRAFHMAHHKHTNDPERDPELSDPKPQDGWAMAWHLSTLGYWRAKGQHLVQAAGGRLDAPYLPEAKRGTIRFEARAYLAAYALVIAAMLSVAPVLFWIWLLPLATGFPVLRLYLLAEHDRCPEVADMFANTRTTLTTRVVRALAWNMPYHAEHHAMPTVPFQHLPRLHGLAKPHLKTLTHGYSDFAADTRAALQPKV